MLEDSFALLSAFPIPQKGIATGEITEKIYVSRDVTPVHHLYESRLPQVDRQKGVDVFPSDDIPVTSTPVVDDLILYEKVTEPMNQEEDESVESESQIPQSISLPPPTAPPRRSVRIQSRNDQPIAKVTTTERQRRQTEYQCMSAGLGLGEVEPD